MSLASAALAATLGLVWISLSTGCSYAHIASGEVGVVRTPEGMNPKILPTCDWNIGFYDNVTQYNVRSQEQDERLEVLAANGLKIVLDASIRYHIVAGEALKLDQELGPQYYATLIGPSLRSQARRVVGRYHPEEIYSKERELIERQIREGVETAIKGRHIILEAVLIRNVQLPDTIQLAINNKLEAEQSALKMKFVIEQAKSQTEKNLLEAKAEAERDKIQAEDRANALRIDAQARADAKRLDGDALADYQRAINKSLSDSMLKYSEIDATRSLSTAENAKIIYLGAGAPPGSLLDLRRSAGAYDK